MKLKCVLKSSMAPVTVALLLFAAAIAASGCAKSEQATEKTTEETTEVTVIETNEQITEEPAFLFVQSSKGFSYDGSSLTVTGTSPTTTFFSDRPDRIAGHTSLEEAYAWGHPSFSENPPNATLSTLAEGEIANVVVTLMNSVVEGDTITWDVDILEGDLPASGGPNTLFIDVIGRPLTPLSVAGVNRRTRRRSMAVGYAVGASTDGYGDDYDDDWEETSTIEERLVELDDLLDRGLITQDDYDREKDELLAGM